MVVSGVVAVGVGKVVVVEVVMTGLRVSLLEVVLPSSDPPLPPKQLTAKSGSATAASGSSPNVLRTF